MAMRWVVQRLPIWNVMQGAFYRFSNIKILKLCSFWRCLLFSHEQATHHWFQLKTQGLSYILLKKLSSFFMINFSLCIQKLSHCLPENPQDFTTHEVCKRIQSASIDLFDVNGKQTSPMLSSNLVILQEIGKIDWNYALLITLTSVVP